MLRIFLVSSFLLIFSFGFSQHSISGKLIDDKNNPIASTEIILTGTSSKTSTKTNSSGLFIFPNVASGNYNLTFKKEGRSQQEKVIVKNNDVNTNLIFKSDQDTVSDIDEVNIIKVKSVKSELEKKGFAVNVIETKEASVRNTQTLELLDQSVGVRIRQDGGLGSRFQFNINGMTGNSIRIFIDGIPMSSYGPAFSLNSIPPAMIDHIEVYKGVVPGYLANDALGGAVNIVLKKEARSSLSASLSYGSFNTSQFNFAGSYRAENGFTVKGSMFYNYSDNDYEVWGRSIYNTNPDGTITHVKAKRFNDAYYSVGSLFEAGATNVKWADQFLLGYTHSSDYKEHQNGLFMNRPYKGRFTRSEINAGSLTYNKKNLFTKGLDFTIRALYSQQLQTTNDTVRWAYNWDGNRMLDMNGKPIRSSYGAQQGEATIRNIKRNSLSSNSGLTYRININHSFTLNHMFQYLDRNEDDEVKTVLQRLYQENSNLTRNNFALSYELSAFENKLKTSVFGKYYSLSAERIRPVSQNINGQPTRVEQRDQRKLDAQGYGFAGSYLVANSVMLLASAERAVRLPEENEIFGDVSQNMLDNFNLRPEISNNFNLGFKLGPYKLAEHQVSLATNGFVRDAKDRIFRFNIQTTTSMPDAAQNVNYLKTRAQGVDFEFNYNYKKDFFIMFNLSKFKSFMNRKEDVATYKEQIPNEPVFTMNANAQYTFRNVLGKDANLILFYNYRFIDQFSTMLKGTLVGLDYFNVPQQNIQDAGISYQFPKKDFIVSFDVKNITNKQAFDNFAVQKPGRAFYLKINYVLNNFNK